MKPIIQQTACTLVTGFLGSGKTTLINQLLSQKKPNERWALLINEFGKIGIDGGLLNAPTQDIAIREVSGGCICCTSQLSLQIALVRLLNDHQPSHLLIEPTGLSHPKELINQLSQPHWQSALSLKSIICVLNAQQWQQPKYQNHEGYQNHIKFCDLVVINRSQALSLKEKQQLKQWLSNLNNALTVIWMDTATEASMKPSDENINALQAALTQRSGIIKSQTTIKTFSLMSNHPSSTHLKQDDQTTTLNDVKLPFRYHDTQAEHEVMGWKLPAHWQADIQALQDWLLSLPNWQRIKGIIHTHHGWQRLNFTPESLSTSSTSAYVDNRLEIILAADNATINGDDKAQPQTKWQQWDTDIMALFQQ